MRNFIGIFGIGLLVFAGSIGTARADDIAVFAAELAFKGINSEFNNDRDFTVNVGAAKAEEHCPMLFIAIPTMPRVRVIAFSSVSERKATETTFRVEKADDYGSYGEIGRAREVKRYDGKPVACGVTIWGVPAPTPTPTASSF